MGPSGGASSGQQRSPRCPSRATSCHAVLGTSPRTGSGLGDLIPHSAIAGWHVGEGELVGFLSSSHARPIQGGPHLAKRWGRPHEGLLPQHLGPQCLTEPGTSIPLLSRPHPLLPGPTEAEPGHTPRTLAGERPDFIPSSSPLALLEPSSSCRLWRYRSFCSPACTFVNKQARQTSERQAEQAGVVCGSAHGGCRGRRCRLHKSAQRGREQAGRQEGGRV